MNAPVFSTSPERRAAYRKLVRLTAVLELEGAAPLAVRTVEVSEEGVALSSPLNIRPGRRCVVRVAVPTRPRQPMLVAQGTVTHSVLSQRDGGFRVGVQFQALPRAVQERLQSFMSD